MIKIRDLGAMFFFTGIFFLLLVSISAGGEGDDSFEDNDEMETATQIEPGIYPDLNSSDPDWYRVNCTTTGILRITVWYPVPIGRVGLYLYSSNGTLLDSSDLGTGEERVETHVPEDEEYLIEVRNETDTEYHMAVVNGNQESWIFSVYMDGDNTLNDSKEQDLEEMRQVGSGGGLRLPVLMDGDRTGDSGVIIVIPGEDIALPLYVVNQSWHNEVNMGDPATLRDWLDWCIRTYDTGGRVALDLWNHGKGVWGCCWDAHSGNDLLTLSEIGEVLNDSQGKPLELLGSDCCLMQVLELSSEIDGLASYFIASQEDEPKNGWNYSCFLGELARNPDWSGEELGRSIIDGYFREYGTGGDETLSVIRLEEIPFLIDALKNLITELAGNTALWADEVRAARAHTSDYSSYHADIRDFAVKLKDRTDNETIRTLAQEIADGVEDAVIYEKHGTKSYNSNGISFYFPLSGYKQEYDDITFSAETGWGDYIKTWRLTPGGPTDHFDRVYFYPLDNDSYEGPDTIKVQFRPFTDKEEENATIFVELQNETGVAAVIQTRDITLHSEDADYSFIYLHLPQDSPSGWYRVTLSLYDSDGNRDEVRVSPELQLDPYNSTTPLPELMIEVEDVIRINEGETANLTVRVITGVPVLFD